MLFIIFLGISPELLKQTKKIVSHPKKKKDFVM